LTSETCARCVRACACIKYRIDGSPLRGSRDRACNKPYVERRLTRIAAVKTSSSFPPPRRILEVAANGAGVGGQSQFRTRPPRRHSGPSFSTVMILASCSVDAHSHAAAPRLYRYSGMFRTLSRAFCRANVHYAAKHLITTRRCPPWRLASQFHAFLSFTKESLSLSLFRLTT